MLGHAAVTVLGPDAACSTEQSSGGEDFAWYLEHVPGAMARIGVWPGHGPMRDLHQPTFDLDERALPVRRPGADAGRPDRPHPLTAARAGSRSPAFLYASLVFEYASPAFEYGQRAAGVMY